MVVELIVAKRESRGQERDEGGPLRFRRIEKPVYSRS